MGIMALPRAHASLSEEIIDAAREFMTGRIEVIDPGNIIETPYDPDTDTGGDSAPAILLTNAPGDPVRGRPARIQPNNSPNDVSGAGAWGTKRTFLMQIEMLDGDPILQKGQVVVVLDGAEDPSLTAFTHTLLSAVNSTQAALRTLRTVTEATA